MEIFGYLPTFTIDLPLRIIGPSKKEGFDSVLRRVLLDLQFPPVT